MKNKILVIALIVWPYLPWFHMGGYLGALENVRLFMVYELLAAVLIAVNAINAGKWDSPKDLFFYYMMFQFVHFPFYIIECLLVVYIVPVTVITGMKGYAIEMIGGALLIAGLFITKNIFRNIAIDKAKMLGIISEQDLGIKNVLQGKGIGDLVLYFKIRRVA